MRRSSHPRKMVSPPLVEPAALELARDAGEHFRTVPATVEVELEQTEPAVHADTNDLPREGWSFKRPSPDTIRRALFMGWVIGSVGPWPDAALSDRPIPETIGRCGPGPGWLVDEAEQMGGRLGVRVPEILVVAHLATPMLWCLGRPKLLVPGRLIKSLEAARWRGILAHELAHLSPRRPLGGPAGAPRGSDSGGGTRSTG